MRGKERRNGRESGKEEGEKNGERSQIFNKLSLLL
jgi:hypothetical protein